MARLKVLVVDCFAGRGAAGPAPQSMGQTEVMRHALLADLDALGDVEVTAIVADPAPGRIAGMAEYPDRQVRGQRAEYAPAQAAEQAPAYTAGEAVGLSLERAALLPAASRFGAQFEACLQAADAVWPLAFESAGALEHLSREILRARRILLGSMPAAVQVAGSKLKLTQVLAEGGVATVATYSPHAAVPQDGGAWVVKPDDGAGCRHTMLFSDRAAALAWIRTNGADGYVLQPFVPGRPGSLSLICCDGAARVLSCNRERVAMRDNRFHVLGSLVNGLSDDEGALERLAQQVAAAIPGLWGYVGIDLILTGHGAVVLDVNPRLTAAYAGLHASIDRNPAGLVLDLLSGAGATPFPAPDRRRPVSVDIGAH